MSFEEELRNVIRIAKRDSDSYEQEGWDFSRRWEELRGQGGLIRSALEDAKKAFRAENIMNVSVKPENGSIVLSVDYNTEHRLSFTANKESRTITCRSKKGIDEEPYTIDRLTEAEIKDKVRQFVDLVIRGKAPLRS